VTVDKETRARLEAAGFRVGNAEDFLGLSDEECRLVALRLAVSRAVRRLRLKHGMTQQQLAAKLKSSQSRVAKIEAGAAGVSLDLSFQALFAAGGGLADLAGADWAGPRAGKKGRPGSRRDKAKTNL
jgi:DNA-binding XRE family transcriptional regulator